MINLVQGLKGKKVQKNYTEIKEIKEMIITEVGMIWTCIDN